MSELERVAHQVEENLLHLLAIAREGGQRPGQVSRDGQLRADDDRLELGPHLEQQIGQLEGRDLQGHAPGFDA